MICIENNMILDEVEEAQMQAECAKWAVGKQLHQLISSPTSSVHSLTDVFSLWDVSGDGIVDRREFKMGLRSIDVHLSKRVGDLTRSILLALPDSVRLSLQRFNNFVRSLDPDRTGDISLLEFENALQEYVEAADSTAFLEDHCVEVKEGLAAKAAPPGKL